MDIIDCSGWYFCNHCRSNTYIIDDFPSNHWAHTAFKTKRKRIIEQHESSEGHIKHFEKYYCQACDKQCFSLSEFKSHCETIRHKQKNNITMNCEVCNYSTSDKSNYERHMFTLKHKNAINGVVKKKENYICEPCSFTSKYESKLKEHQETQKHQNIINGVEIKESDLFCNLCNFKGMCKSAMNVHKKSKKHQNAVAYEESKQII